jgi:glycosyltransferase involved in cell wall biosynthesis
VIQLCEFAREEAGAFVPMIHDLCRRALERGWQAEVVLTSSSRGLVWVDELEAAGIRVRILRPSSRLGFVRRLRRILAESDVPTVLHSHFTTFDLPSVLAAWRSPRTLVVWHVHTTLPTQLVWIARNVLKFATIGRRAAAILCPAQNIADGTVRRLAPVERVHFYPSALDIAAYPLQTPERRRAARRELGLPEDATVLMHFGWHWYLKGGDIFMEVVERLRGEGVPRLRALERGGAETADREVRERGLEDAVTVVPPVEDIRLLFAAADVLVSSSRSEGMAYSVLESLSSGTPVVATQIPGHAFIGARTPACRIARRDPADLAAAVRQLLDRDPARAAAEAEESRRWVDENLGYAVVNNRLLDNYASLLAGQVPRRWS